jgi:hypothetical protein
VILWYLLAGSERRNVLDETLVDAHLEAIPGLGTLTARGLAGGDLEGPGGETDGALDAELLALRAVDQLTADLLEGLDLARLHMRVSSIRSIVSRMLDRSELTYGKGDADLWTNQLVYDSSSFS